MQIWTVCSFDVLRLKFDGKLTAEERNIHKDTVAYSKISFENSLKAATLNIDNLNPQMAL